MSNINWSLLHLKSNPFSIMPDKESKDLIWAGFETSKHQIEGALKNIFSSKETKVILNISRWGGGKTHASYYFSNPKNLSSIILNGVSNPLSIVIITSKEGNNAAYDFFKKILDSINIERITGTIRFLRRTEGEDESLIKIKSLIVSEPLARIVWLLGSASDEDSFEACEMLFNGTTAAQRKKYRLIRGIEDTSDRFKILSCIFKILSEYDIDQKINNRKIIIWMDEIESLIVYTPKQYIPFTQAIRELIDMTPFHFCFIMNFSLSDYDNLRTLEYIIGKALSDRVSFRIIFDEPTIQEAETYVVELLKSYRLESFDIQNEIFPFNAESLKYLFEKVMQANQVPLMPRNVNKYIEYLIDKAFQEQLIEKEQEVSIDFMKTLTFKEVN